jgi:hypothetical protein
MSLATESNQLTSSTGPEVTGASIISLNKDPPKMKIKRLCKLKEGEDADEPYDTATQIKKSE